MGELTSWQGDGFLAQMEGQLDGKCALAAEQVATQIRDNLNVDYPPASQEGQSPHRRTGRLQGAVRVDKKAPGLYWVGVWTPYAVFLELGTAKMGKRPHILKSLMEKSQTVYQIILGDLNPVHGLAPFAPSFAPSFTPYYALSTQLNFSFGQLSSLFGIEFDPSVQGRP